MKKFDRLNEKGKTIDEVARFMVSAHAGQFRKGIPIPYFSHPMSVLRIAAVEWEVKDRITLDAILCHDVKEDCKHVKESEIVDMIGDTASGVVDELTFEPDKDAPISVADQKVIYMDGFFDSSIRSLVGKFADRVDNTCDYILSDPNYAVEYWNKASSLITAFQSRYDEITDFYGLEVAASMRYSKNIIEQKLQ